MTIAPTKNPIISRLRPVTIPNDIAWTICATLCEHDRQESHKSEHAHSHTLTNEHPRNEDGKDEHEIGGQPVVIRSGGTCTYETISPRSSTRDKIFQRKA